jgi:Tol biopolymer transport system component
VSNFEGEDREPVWGTDESFYYLSEKDGSQNIYKASLSAKDAVPVTKLKEHPVRNLSRSGDGTLCFTYNGEIYTMKDNSAPAKVNISINADIRGNDEKILPVNANVTQTALSPNGKEIAFVVRGEVFVTSVEGGLTKRITNTPQQERTVEFSPDGRSLYYATERGNSWDIYRAYIERKEEPYFYASTVIKEEPLIATDAGRIPTRSFSDGKEIAYGREIFQSLQYPARKRIIVHKESITPQTATNITIGPRMKMDRLIQKKEDGEHRKGFDESRWNW